MSRESRRMADRMAAAFVLCVLAVGSLTLWIGVPLGAMWGIGKVTETSREHVLWALIGIPFAMALFAPLLFWLNGLYIRIRATRRSRAPQEEWDEEDEGVVVRGPLELLLAISFVIAFVALFVWFFFFAENPPHMVL